MINHARTILLNRASRSYNSDMLGEEYIPQFSPLVLPSNLKLAHKLLFGADPDKVFLNYRAYELLSLIHQTELAEFVFALDPRITYPLKGHDDFFRGTVTTDVARTGGFAYAQLNLVGTAKANNATGRAYFEYLMRVIENNENSAIAQLIPLTGDTATRVVTWLVPAVPGPLPLMSDRPVMRQTLAENLGVSEPVAVPDTQLLFQLSLNQDDVDLLATEDPIPFKTESLFAPNNIEIEKPLTLQLKTNRPVEALQAQQILAEWRLQVYAKPDSAISACLPKLEMLGEPFYLELFGVSDTEAPYTTFKNIWFDHPLPAYRLAAFVLAMIYRMNSLRVNNG